MPEDTPFFWSANREQAARLEAAGELTPEEIAAQLRITKRQLLLWRQHPVFKARVAALTVARTRRRPPP